MSVLTIERPDVDPLDDQWVPYTRAERILGRHNPGIRELARQNVIRVRRGGKEWDRYYLPDILAARDSRST